MFDIDLWAPTDKPIIYLNEDIQNFHRVLNEPDNNGGKPSGLLKARRAVDPVLAVQVMIQVLSTIIQHISVLAVEARDGLRDEISYEFVYDSLSEHEQTIVSAWRKYLGVTHDHEDGTSVCVEIASQSEFELSRHLTSTMPRWIRSQMGIEDAISTVIERGLKQMSDKDDA